jgi:hypothetical protein
MLTNFDLDSTTCFATLLIGQPALRLELPLGVLAAVDQHIAIRARLDPHDPRGNHRIHQAPPGELLVVELSARAGRTSAAGPRRAAPTLTSPPTTARGLPRHRRATIIRAPATGSVGDSRCGRH